MKLSEMIAQLSKIQEKCGDMDVILHDSADGSDFIGMSIYKDEGCECYPDECVIGFDSDSDIR